MLTGCRRNEIMGLAWDDQDFEAGEMRLADSKAGPRIVPMPPAAAEVLAALPRTPDNRWVFLGWKKGTHQTNINNSWNRIRERADLDGVRLHDLRHSSAIYQENPAPISVSTGNNLLITRNFFHSVQTARIHSQDLRKQSETGFACLAVTSCVTVRVPGDEEMVIRNRSIGPWSCRTEGGDAGRRNRGISCRRNGSRDEPLRISTA